MDINPQEVINAVCRFEVAAIRYTDAVNGEATGELTKKREYVAATKALLRITLGRTPTPEEVKQVTDFDTPD